MVSCYSGMKVRFTEKNLVGRYQEIRANWPLIGTEVNCRQPLTLLIRSSSLRDAFLQVHFFERASDGIQGVHSLLLKNKPYCQNCHRRVAIHRCSRAY